MSPTAHSNPPSTDGVRPSRAHESPAPVSKRLAAVPSSPLLPGDGYWENGGLVFTSHYLKRRGFCCGNGCRHCPYGFSLVELCVVVAVLGFLGAILLPALGKGRAQAQRAHCINNLRQLGLASQLYWTDHQGRAFRYKVGTTSDGDLYWFGWLSRGSEGTREFDSRQGVLHPYLEGRGVDLCPGFRYDDARFKLKSSGASHGYGYNLLLSAARNRPALDIDSLRQPSATTLFADSAQVNDFQAPASKSNPMLEEFYYVNASEPTTHFRHGERANVGFVDGHVDREEAVVGSLDTRLPGETLGRLRSEIIVPR